MSGEQTRRLQRKARQWGRSPSETGAMLLDEALRRADFAFVDFRDTASGRHAFVLGSRLAVWQVVSAVRAHAGDVDRAAAHLGWPVLKVRAAMNYARTFETEVEEALSDAQSVDVAQLERTLPQLEQFTVPAAPAARS